MKESLREVRMELRTMREVGCVEKMHGGDCGEDERRVDWGKRGERSERKKGEERERGRPEYEGNCKEAEVEEPRSKKGKKNENGTRFEEELVAGREAWEETSVDRKRERRREENEGGLEEERCSERVSRREDRRGHGELICERRSAEILVKKRGMRRGNGGELGRF